MARAFVPAKRRATEATQPLPEVLQAVEMHAAVCGVFRFGPALKAGHNVIASSPEFTIKSGVSSD